MQSHNQILRAAASGDVTALRRVARETDLITAVQNKVYMMACLLHVTCQIPYKCVYCASVSVWLDGSALCCLQWSSGDAAGASGEVQL